jgi:hypothetical protein
MLTHDRAEGAQRSIHLVKSSLLQAIESGAAILPVHEAQVHRTIDLLREAPVDPQIRARMESISCLMSAMRPLLGQGRVNAYASARLRIRSAANAL